MKESLREQVTKFHFAAGVPVHFKPKVPNDERVRLRLELIREEFFELLDAALILGEGNAGWTIADDVRELIEKANVRVDLPRFVDAQGDLDYVNEGTRLEFGVSGREIADEIQRANMAKFIRCDHDDAGLPRVGAYACAKCLDGGYLALVREDGKVLKPEGWTPPDIEGVLRTQGWEPLSGSTARAPTSSTGTSTEPPRT